MDRIITNNRPLEELVAKMSSSPEKYKQLQVFLHRKREDNYTPDKEFLMVTPSVFGKVEVLDLTVEGNFINIEFLDCVMQEHGNIWINISDEKPSVSFICWQDVKKMVLNETLPSSNDELLDFEF